MQNANDVVSEMRGYIMVDGTQLRAAQVIDRERAAAVCDFAQLLADQMLGAVPPMLRGQAASGVRKVLDQWTHQHGLSLPFDPLNGL